MREYKKPEMMIERFQANVAVASGCTRVKTEDITYWPKQTVDCVISGSETVFTESRDCSTSGVQTVTYNGTLYIIWKAGFNGNVSGSLDDLYPILNAANISYDSYGKVKGSNSLYWHAGPASSATKPGYGFSY